MCSLVEQMNRRSNNIIFPGLFLIDLRWMIHNLIDSSFKWQASLIWCTHQAYMKLTKLDHMYPVALVQDLNVFLNILYYH